MAETGRAWLFTGVDQPFEPREFPLPEVEPGGILVRLTVANICGSDLHGWHGRTPRSGPTIMGHEMTGRIAKLGSRVKTDSAGTPLVEGDPIVYSYFYPWVLSHRFPLDEINQAFAHAAAGKRCAPR